MSDKPVQCAICGNSFTDKYTLKVHKWTHRGEKCFKCALCYLSFKTKFQLESHTVKHTGQRQYGCDQCDERFNLKKLLKSHNKSKHDGGFIPKVSEYQHTERKERSLNVEEAPAKENAVSPTKKGYHCTICDRSFDRGGPFARHITIHRTVISLNQGKPQEVEVVDRQLIEKPVGEDFTDHHQQFMQHLNKEVQPEQEDKRVRREQDRQTCFGFDEESNDEEFEPKYLTPEEVTRLSKKEDLANCFGFDDEFD